MTLSANTDYWLILSASGTGTAAAYKWGYTGANASFPSYAYSRNNGSSWTVNTTSGPFLMEVDSTATPVPVPASLWLVLSGIGGLCGVGRHRGNASATRA